MTARISACVVAIVFAAMPAVAQTSSPREPSKTRQTVTFLAGAAAGLGVHEAGHVITSAVFGANPSLAAIDFGPIPFFAIHHDPVTRRQEYVISASGFWMQYAGSEWLLSARPNLRREHAPFEKGMLAFHVGVSAMYGTAAFGRFGAAERDTRGMAATLRPGGVPEPVVGVLVLAPAALDAYRYFRPESAWARWASRGAKVLVVALAAR